MRPRGRRPLRLLDGMILVVAVAFAFTIYREGIAGGVPFTTFGFSWEPSLFYWMHQVVPFPAMGSLALSAITAMDRTTPKRRKFRHAGAVASCAAAVVLAITTLVGTSFYALHLLEDYGLIRKVLSHHRFTHAPPPFANTPTEEFIGAAVLGAWAVMAASGRWRLERSWIDLTGFALGLVWVALFLLYLYGYTG